MKNVVVLTCDFINSSQYEQKVLKTLLQQVKEEFENIKEYYGEDGITFSIYRGDSIQGVLENPAIALEVALQLKSVVTKFAPVKVKSKNSISPTDIRISIGIGTSEYEKEAISESNGEAFQLSGRTLDIMKDRDMKMAITTADPEINSEFKVHTTFLDATTDRWSIASAEVIYYLLKGYKEQKIADTLKLSQAAINHRKKAAGWDEIKQLLNRYSQVAKKHFI